jgi:hypothetical protein
MERDGTVHIRNEILLLSYTGRRSRSVRATGQQGRCIIGTLDLGVAVFWTYARTLLLPRTWLWVGFWF